MQFAPLRLGRGLPPVTVLTLAVILFSAFVRLDEATDSALARESVGSVRGAMVAANGQTIVSSAPSGEPQISLPGLAPIVGYRDPAGRWHGLEGAYESVLSGESRRHGLGAFFAHLTGHSIQGGNLNLTIEPFLQRVAAAALGAHRGAVVALDPRTGAVLAIVSSPSCNPSVLATPAGYRHCSADPHKPLLDRPIDFLGAPGSSFKIVTLTAALDTETFQLDTVFSGADIFGPSPYFDNSEYPSNITTPGFTALTLSQALAFSDNFTFAHIGIVLGSNVLRRYARRYYIGRRIPFDLRVAVSHTLAGLANPSTAVLAQSSFGAPTDMVTPLQMAIIAETVANGGVAMRPFIVRSEELNGAVVATTKPEALGRVMSPASASNVTEAMSFVVNHGSGYAAQISGIQVAGKTGTAASGRDKPNAWFIAFAPADHPRIAVAVLKQFSGEGATAAAPIARKVILAALGKS